MDERLEAVQRDVGNRMDQILAHFKDGSKITVVVRQPDDPYGTRDFMMTNDELDKVVAGLTRKRYQTGRRAWLCAASSRTCRTMSTREF